MKLPERIAIVTRCGTAAARDVRIHLNVAAPGLTDAPMNRDGA